MGYVRWIDDNRRRGSVRDRPVEDLPDMKHISQVTDAVLLDLARRMAAFRVRAAETTLTNAIETRGVLNVRIEFLRRELETARRGRASLLAIPEPPK
jgi:hypothetical protein